MIMNESEKNDFKDFDEIPFSTATIKDNDNKDISIDKEDEKSKEESTIVREPGIIPLDSEPKKRSIEERINEEYGLDGLSLEEQIYKLETLRKDVDSKIVKMDLDARWTGAPELMKEYYMFSKAIEEKKNKLNEKEIIVNDNILEESKENIRNDDSLEKKFEYGEKELELIKKLIEKNMEENASVLGFGHKSA